MLRYVSTHPRGPLKKYIGVLMYSALNPHKIDHPRPDIERDSGTFALRQKIFFWGNSNCFLRVGIHLRRFK